MSEEYLGFKQVELDGDKVQNIFSDNVPNEFGLLQNEYLKACDKNGNVIRLMRCDNDKLYPLPYKAIDGKFIEKIKPRNPEQQMAIDMLYNHDITIKIIAGKFGAGKDLLMTSAAVDMVMNGDFDKIVYVRNNIEVKNSKAIGFLPGSYTEKMLPFVMPLADHVGGVDGLHMMMEEDQLEIIHLGFIRGRDIRKSIIICSEAENMTKEHIQLLIGRVGEGSELWINGDLKQCDAEVFEKNSGLMTAVQKLKGHPRFGYVKLLKSERSETAAMADLLD